MKAKRTVAGILACAMLATAVSVQASAAGTTVTLSGENVKAEAGQEFSVDVSLTDVPASKINTLDFAVKYDADALDITKVTVGEAAAEPSGDATAAEAPIFATTVKDGQIAVSWTTALASDAWIAADGVVLTISGTVKDGTADGVYPLTFAPVARKINGNEDAADNDEIVIGYVYGADSAEYEVKTEDGSVTVGSPDTTTTDKQTTTTDKQTTTSETTTVSKATDSTDDTDETTESTKSTIDVPADVLYGDVNLDARIDLTDAIVLNKYCADVVDLTDPQLLNADCTADGNVDSNDSIALLRFLVHIINSLPGE